MGDVGEKELAETLRARGHSVDLLKDVPAPDQILRYDCLIIMGGSGGFGLGKMTSDRRLNIMEYVNRGYGVLLIADACGFRTWYDDFRSPFPEVESPVGKVATMTGVVKGEHPVTAGLPKRFRYGPKGWDAIVMEPGPSGRVILTNVDGAIIGVAGEVGKGRVVALGPFVGVDIEKPQAEGPMQQLAVNCVAWLAGVKEKESAAPFLVRPAIRDEMQRAAVRLAQGLKLEDTYCSLEIDGDWVRFDAGRIRNAQERKDVLGRLDAIFTDLKNKQPAIQKRIDAGCADAELDGAIGGMKQACVAALEPVRARVTGLEREPFPPPMRRRAPPSLEECVRKLDADDVAARRHAALEIGRIGNQKAIVGMLRILKDPQADRELRINIIYACGWNKVGEAVDLLMFLAKDKDVFIRRRAVQALGQMGDKRALPAIQEARQDPDKDVQENAGFAEKWLSEGFNCPIIDRPADYDYDWHLNGFTRVQQLDYTSAMRPWPWDRLVRYAAEIQTSLTMLGASEAKDSLPLVDQYQMRASFFRGSDTKEAILKTLAVVGKYSASVVMHYDEPGGKQIDELRELADFTHGLRKDLLYSSVLMKVFAHVPAGTSYATAAPSVDIIMVDPYDGGAMEEAFLCDLQRSCARGVNWVTLSGFVPDPGQSAQDLAISYAHTQGLWPFIWQYYFKQPIPAASTSMRRYWQKGGRWEAVVANYRKMAKIEPYLAQARSPAQIALVYSERSANSPVYAKTPNIGRPGRYFQNQAGIYHALAQQHVQFDSVFAEHLKGAPLGQYKVLVLSDARDLSAEEAAVITAWVQAGGILLAGGNISPALADVLPATVAGAVGGARDEELCLYVDRETKPEGGFVRAKPTSGAGASPAMQTGFEYETALGYRKLTPRVMVPGGNPAVVLASWEDGLPAMVEGAVGRGKVIYFGADYMGLTYTDVDYPIVMGRAWFPQWKVFYPGTREFLASLIRGGLKAAGGQELVTVANCPAEVEVKVLRQEGRFIIHFTNYDEKAAGKKGSVKGIKAEFACDPAEIERVHSPEDDREMRFEKTAAGIRFEVPEFSLFHRAVVVEMKPQGSKKL